jgi:Skp family chaperone for outer membrane proteins
MNSSNIVCVAGLGVACLLGLAADRAQNAAVGVGDTRIGIVNIRGAISSTAEGKQAVAELQSQFTSRQQELETLNKLLNELQQRLSKAESTLSDEEKAGLSAQVTRTGQRLDRKTNEYQEDLNAAQGDIM